MRKLLFLALSCWTLVTQGETAKDASGAAGEMIVTNLPSAPFPHPDRKDGHKYKDKFFPADKHYSDSTVVIFVPPGFHATQATDFVVHFHGWGGTATNAILSYKLSEQMAASGRNAILIVPQGPLNASDSFGGKLEDSNGFKRFMNDVVATLKNRGVLQSTTIGNIILSGHSGGYHVMGGIVDRGGLNDKIKELWLFDAQYGQTESYAHWLDEQHGKILNIYTENGGTKAESEKFVADLKKKGTAVVAKKEAEITPEDLQENRLVFIYTPMVHNDVVAKNRTFESFLKASCLQPINGK